MSNSIVKLLIDRAQQHYDAKRYKEVIALLDKANSEHSANKEASLLLAMAFYKMHDYTQAIAICESLFRLCPDDAQVVMLLARALFWCGRVTEATNLHLKLVTESQCNPSQHSRMIHYAQFDSTLTGIELLAFSRTFESQHGSVYIPNSDSFLNSPKVDRPLRVGFVSTELQNHSKYFFIRPLFEAFDRQQVELYVYSDAKHPDAHTARIKAVTDHWRDIREVNDDDVRQQIRTDRIDILVDLMGHLDRNRLLCLFDKPAPIVIEYGESPSGLSLFDYRLTDAIADPHGSELPASTPLVRLPHGFHCYEPGEDMPAIRPLPPASRAQPVLGYFGVLPKISNPVWAAWIRILKQVPQANLMLKHQTSYGDWYPEKIRQMLVQHDIDPERARYYPASPIRNLHLQTYSLIDVSLDTSPYTGVTTICEALWMGKPVITLNGSHHMARRGASLLHSAGLQHWVASDWDAYVDKAVSVINNCDPLARLRGDALREHVRASSLANADTLARSMEQAFRTMWRAWCTQVVVE